MYHQLVTTIQNLLKKQNVWFETFEHEEVRTSEEAAKLRHGYTISQGAKALILKAKLRDGQNIFMQCVLPGDRKLANAKVKQLVDAKEIRFATPDEIFALTKGVVPGGVPPFGNLFGIRIFVDPLLLAQEKIVFNAGDRKFSIAMKSVDYKNIVDPTIGEISQ